jgi:hypothetical protein
MWELYAFWAWVGVIATASYSLDGSEAARFLGKLTAFLAIGLGGLACVPAGWLAVRFGSARVAQLCLFSSSAAALASAVLFGGPAWQMMAVLILWGIAIIPDSALYSTLAGLADQDHAAALSLSSKVHPLTGGMLYCNILWACRTFGDWARANQWTLGYQDFCSASRMEFSGYCQLHRAEVLGIRGSLRDALAHVEDSVSRLADDGPWALGDAHRVLGDIHSAIGNLDGTFCFLEMHLIDLA